MKITFVLPDASLSGGVKVVATHARNLLERGHEVTVVSTPLPPPSLRERVKRLVKGWGQTAAKQTGRTYFDGTGVHHRVIERFRPIEDGDVPDADVVIATWWETAEWVARLSDRKGAKAYFVQHYEVWGGAPARVEATYRLPMHKIVISRWLEEILREKFGATEMSYVPNAVDLGQFHALERGKQAAPTVGLIYSHVEFKGYDLGLRAVRLMQQAMPGLKVRLFGASEVWAEKFPLPENCQFTCQPPQDRIRDIYAACDVWLYTSRSEGFGLPVLEAMACRTPVVGTPAGAAPELIGEGGGILVPYDDAEAMAEAALRVLRMSDGEWKRMSEQAYRTAAGYSWEDAAARMEGALEAAIAAAGRAVTV